VFITAWLLVKNDHGSRVACQPTGTPAYARLVRRLDSGLALEVSLRVVVSQLHSQLIVDRFYVGTVLFEAFTHVQ
jgi:hypothetical protein